MPELTESQITLAADIAGRQKRGHHTFRSTCGTLDRISPELTLVIGDFGLSYSERRDWAGSAAAARTAGRAEARIARVSMRKTLAV